MTWIEVLVVLAIAGLVASALLRSRAAARWLAAASLAVLAMLLLLFVEELVRDLL